MGRLTYEREFVRPEGIFRKESNGKSIIKIIMTKRTDVKDDPEDQAYYVQDWVQAKDLVEKFKPKISEAWNVGGPSVYKAQLDDKNDPSEGKLILTTLQKVFDCDVFYPKEYIKDMKLVESSEVHEENGVKLQFHTYNLF